MALSEIWLVEFLSEIWLVELCSVCDTGIANFFTFVTGVLLMLNSICVVGSLVSEVCTSTKATQYRGLLCIIGSQIHMLWFSTSNSPVAQVGKYAQACQLYSSLVPRSYPLTRRDGLVNQVEFLWLAHTCDSFEITVVGPNEHTHTFVWCCPASVGFAQVRTNCIDWMLWGPSC